MGGEEKIQGGARSGISMAESRKQIEIRRSQTDVLVYAAIRYLDSATNYRECLPHMAQSRIAQDQKPSKKSAVEKNDLVLLDDMPAYRLSWLWTFALIAIFLCMILVGLLRS